MAEQVTLNHWVEGSSPSGLTTTARRAAAAGLTVAMMAGVWACAGSPTGPCLGAQAESVVVPFQHLLGVWHESDGQTELAQFRFDMTVPGSTRVTVALATPPYIEFAFGEARADVQGQRETSVVMDGLVGGASTDRLQADPINPYRIREIVQVVEEDGFGWVIGTDGDSCLRLRSNVDEGTVTIVVTAPAVSD
jgi:hypothetical protein